MYKGRLSIWIALLAICFGINTMTSLLPKLFESDEVSIYFESTYDLEGKGSLNNKDIGKYEVKIDSQNPDVIFTDKEINNPSEYTKYEDALYTPLVMYMRAYAVDKPDGLILVQPKEPTSTPFKIDLNAVLNGMEKDKSWKDLGINNKVAKNKIALTIPNETNSYYESVVELFYLALNNYNMPTEDERTLLKPRVDALIQKCEKVSDISQEIIAEYDDPSTDYKVFIGPEYLYIRGGTEMSRSYDDAFIPVYFNKTILFNMDMYLKNNHLENQESSSEMFREYIQEKPKLVARLGWRLTNVNFSMDNINFQLPDFVEGFAIN